MPAEPKNGTVKIRPFGAAWVSLTILLAGAGPSLSKTIMWLGNFYQQGTFQNGDVGGVDSVWVPVSPAGSTTGYYLGGVNLKLTRATRLQAYVDTAQTLSSFTTWWSIPTWNSSQYRESRIRLVMNYRKFNGVMANPPYQSDRVESQEMNGMYTGAGMVNVVDSCVDRVVGDTAWMYFGLGQISSPQLPPQCSDHNPYLKPVGTVHLLNPWPGRSAWIRFDGKWQAMNPEPGRPGWLVSKFFGLPTAAIDCKVVFASGDPATDPAVQYLDRSGVGASTASPLDFNADPKPWEKWIAPAVDGTLPPKVFAAAPALLRTLMVRMPLWNATSLRMTWKNVPGRFYLQATPLCEWYAASLYAGVVPTAIVINHPYQDSIFGARGSARAPADYATFSDWISLAGIPAGSDTIWLNTKGVSIPTTAKPLGTDLKACNEKILAFKVYDYKLPGTYFPFSEATNTGPLKGMVKTVLGADGNVQSSGKSICAAGTANASCTDPANGPGNWFNARPDNTTGCLQQPLTYNPTSGAYEYQSSAYFPIDNLITNAAYNEKLGGSQSHDFGFCMHAKSTFEYVPGLQFKFSGDDDVWIFIDKKLALDLGGQHAALSGDINLDKMSLTEGKAYQFDMFYCERHTPGSNIMIQTTMNLVPSFDFRFDSSGVSNGGMAIDLKYVKTEIDPSKCADETANPQYIAGPGIFLLQYPDGHTEAIDTPPASPQFKGLKISNDLTRIEINLDSIKTSKNLKQRGAYKIVIRFQNDPSQANIKEIPFEITGGPVDLTADLYDRDGDGKADSLIVRGSVTPVFANGAAKWIRQAWSKSDATRDSTLIPKATITVKPGDSVLVATWTAAATPFQKRTGCPLTGCLDMGWVATWDTGFKDTIRNPIKVLREHLAPFADSARLSYGTAGAADTLRVWIGEGAMQWPAAGAQSPWAMIGNRGASRALTVSDASNPSPIAQGGRLLQLVLAAGHGIQFSDSLRLAERVSDSLGNSSVGSSVWVPIRSIPVATSWMLDMNGDGAPDSVAISGKGSLALADSARVQWKTALGADTTVSVKTQSGIAAGLRLPSGILGGATWCATCQLEVWTKGKSQLFPLYDSVPAVATKAAYRFGATYDTLFVTASEVVSKGSAASEGWVSGKRSGSQDKLGALVSGTATASGNQIQILVAPGTFLADSLRLRKWSLDAFGNAPGATSRWVVIEFGPQPIRVVVRDRDGDGRADSVEIRLTRSATGSPVPTGFGLRWNGETQAATNLVKNADGMSWSGSIGPFAFATTPTAGDAGWIAVGSDVTTFRAMPEDSVPPVAVKARLIFAFDEGDADTLQIEGSEALELRGANLALVNEDSSQAGAMAVVGGTPAVAGKVLKIAVPSGTIANNAAWARFGTSVAQVGGIQVGASSSWVKLVVTPSGRASLYDSDGDGRADSVWVEARGTLDAATAKLVWKTASGTEDSRTWPVGSKTGSFGLHPAQSALWFEKNATSCPAATSCTIEFSTANGTEIATWPLSDKVAATAVRASYSFGSTADTLRVETSEPLEAVSQQSSWLEWGGLATSGGIRHVDARLSASGDELVLVLDTADGARPGWDSVRLASGGLSGRLQDKMGNKEGARGPWVELTFGLPPMTAIATDPRGEGRATTVVATLARPVPRKAVEAVVSFEVVWNGEKRTVKTSDLTWNAAGSWTGNVGMPFATGVTSCGSTCSAKAFSDDGSARDMPLSDGVPPCILEARFRYGTREVARDTLIARFSESWTPTGAADMATAFVTAGRPGSPRQVAPMSDWSLGSDGQILFMVLDTAWEERIRRGDSARLAGGAIGSRLRDDSGNMVGELSPWVPVEFGLRPAEFVLRQENPILANGGRHGEPVWTEPSSDVPKIEMLVRSDATGEWVKLDGNLRTDAEGLVESGAQPANPADRVMGAYLKLNRPFQGHLIVYDNMGIHVTQIDLSPMKALWPADAQGKDALREVKITWNGVGPDGKFVASGVYLMRAVVKVFDVDGHPVFRNLLWKFGWKYRK